MAFEMRIFRIQITRRFWKWRNFDEIPFDPQFANFGSKMIRCRGRRDPATLRRVTDNKSIHSLHRTFDISHLHSPFFFFSFEILSLLHQFKGTFVPRFDVPISLWRSQEIADAEVVAGDSERLPDRSEISKVV